MRDTRESPWTTKKVRARKRGGGWERALCAVSAAMRGKGTQRLDRTCEREQEGGRMLFGTLYT